MADVSYVPGDRTAIVGDSYWALIDAVPDSAVVTEIWHRMQQVSRLDALVASVLRFGLDGVPDFVLLAAAEGGHRLICRGRAGATLIGSDPPRRVDGAGLATWLECEVAATVGRVVLGEPPAESDLRLPASAGVFLAHSVTVGLVAAPRDHGPSAPATVAVAPIAPVPVVAALVAAAPVAGAPASVPDVPQAVVQAGTRWIPELDPGSAEDASYDFLFGATQARTVEDAAVRPAAESEASLPFPFAAAGEPPHGEPLLGRPASPASGGGPAGPGILIDAVPWASGTGPSWPPGDQAAGVPPRLIAAGSAADDDDGSTVMRHDLPVSASRLVIPDRIGPTVHALLCPDSHVNPPGSPACRRCGAPLPPQDPVSVPRPVLGVLRLSTGDVIPLDRGVIMGRSPRTDYHGEERPHVVKLPGGDGEISRTHLHVSLDGWHVLVTDLHSTNGTLVVLPGREAEQLRPGEPVPIPPGTVVVLAADVDFRFEAAE
jgi:hypothetical protein